MIDAAAIGPKTALTMIGEIPNAAITAYDYSRGNVSAGEALFNVLPFGGALSFVKPLARTGRVAEPTGQFYSVAYEMKLSPTSYPGLSRGAHFQEANGSLLRAMEGDAAFAQDMQSLGVNLQRTPTGLAPRTSPSGWTWHHAEDPGVMQLVPRSQHQMGSIFQDALHPNGVGGYSIWGK